ncbi:SanA/YdcF family protein [Crassaminicella profunda]|uniref:SanA/YdcF family protein n=1 Tax=Crassaminicella profunda TaxID=1286698 RepID=UPI001CA728B0|nr:ElyC/SanA/YdcF family protein [Crassaminicella profunda]QZY55794.1 YdcF family protein [Crassaminicella profunda]
MKKYIKKTLKLVLIGMLIGGLSFGLINYHVTSFSDNYITSIENVPNSDAALVLGALVYKSGNVSPILSDRLDTGMEIYKNNKAQKLLLTGDHGRKDYDEVNAMKKYAMNKGAAEADIFMDHAGFSTYESLYRAKDVFGAKKIIIVTQKYHLPRAVYIARKLGIEAYGVPSDKHFYPKIKQYKVRESIARCKDYLLVNILKTKPKYLGEPIDLLGDGRVTEG